MRLHENNLIFAQYEKVRNESILEEKKKLPKGFVPFKKKDGKKKKDDKKASKKDDKKDDKKSTKKKGSNKPSWLTINKEAAAIMGTMLKESPEFHKGKLPSDEYTSKNRIEDEDEREKRREANKYVHKNRPGQWGYDPEKPVEEAPMTADDMQLQKDAGINSEGEDEWFNAKGQPDPNGCFDIGGHYYPDRRAETTEEPDQFDGYSGGTRTEQRRHAPGMKKKLQAMFKEYIKDAEDQDGPGYWENFKTVEEIFQDMVLYVASAEKPDQFDGYEDEDEDEDEDPWGGNGPPDDHISKFGGPDYSGGTRNKPDPYSAR